MCSRTWRARYACEESRRNGSWFWRSAPAAMRQDLVTRVLVASMFLRQRGTAWLVPAAPRARVRSQYSSFPHLQPASSQLPLKPINHDVYNPQRDQNTVIEFVQAHDPDHRRQRK